MAELSPQIQERPKEGLEDDTPTPTPDVHSVSMKIQRAREVYKAYGGIEDKPTKGEVMVWYLYGLCSYFVHTVLIPIVFPLIISQTVGDPPVPRQGWLRSHKDLQCKESEMRLTDSFSTYTWHRFSPARLQPLSATYCWCSHRHRSSLLPPRRFFRKSWIFPPYIAAIVAANTIVGAAHARHLGLMIRGFTGSTIPKRQFPNRRSFASWLSLYSTAAGCLGAAIMASFTYHMLRHSDHFTALWVVSIFSGLKWGLGMIHIFSTNRATASFTYSESNPAPITHIMSIFRYPHAAGSLAGVFLSSFTSMCIFGAGLLYAIGYLCIKTKHILFLWLIYFLIPLVSLPLAHPLQQIMKSDAEKMQLLGFILSSLTSGFGFYYQGSNWGIGHLLLFAAIQGTSTGLLHAFGRVLWLDCSPAGKEGAFSVWFSWARALGACAGFALATAMPGDVGKAFGISFCAGLVGMIVLIFGNISSFRGAKAAGHVIKSEKNSPVHGLDDDHVKGSVTTEVLPQGKLDV
ncbi:UNVERIFIED_CONTAM: hypothetical protein Sradi_5638000 [Sesamum radiatum]|uniref:Uncharacterized protein n=1 Tax=Sesamum radiatum TaxID=300843 RepID=A0AAW2L0Q9_SESRA